MTVALQRAADPKLVEHGAREYRRGYRNGALVALFVAGLVLALGRAFPW